MYRLHNILTSDILNNYERKIQQLINNKILTERDVQAILKVASLFNIPIWRHRFSAIISKCLLLMKNSIESCSFEEMYYLYEIFFKNQEPGDILNIIQRSAAKLLHEIEDTPIINHKNKLQLFSSIIYFSSPISKANFRQNIGQYLNGNQTLQTLISLRKVFSYLKISDNKLWNDYWNQMCQILKEEKNFEKIIKLMENYMYFSMDIYGFKHYAFEHCVFTLIQKYINEGTLTLYPARLFSSFSFVLMCSPHSKLFNNLMGSFVELSSQLTILDIFKISYSIQYSRQKKNLVDDLILKEIQEKLHKGTFKIFSKRNLEPTSVALLTKSMVIRRDFCNYLIEDMLTSLKSMPRMSSKLLEYICYNLAATKYLIPELLNLCTNYVIQHKGNIVGFNIEKIICLLYELNYHPIYDEEFFEAVIDILIRDQERMSGLAFIQAALALSFFNRLPKSLIRQIFNVEFLEKLDVELANCYFKDRYPLRVRHVLMELNRAVCLENPEYNIPWFHHKYLEEYKKNNAIDDVATKFHLNVKGYLLGIIGEDALLENVTIPYGYDIDFVYHLDKNNKITNNVDESCTRKFALLLKNNEDYTKMYVQLKGNHSLKNRHLEILGYKVKIIKRNIWDNLLYAEEKKDFINEILF